jgi:hypothetical protein
MPRLGLLCTVCVTTYFFSWITQLKIYPSTLRTNATLHMLTLHGPQKIETPLTLYNTFIEV